MVDFAAPFLPPQSVRFCHLLCSRCFFFVVKVPFKVAKVSDEGILLFLELDFFFLLLSHAAVERLTEDAAVLLRAFCPRFPSFSKPRVKLRPYFSCAPTRQAPFVRVRLNELSLTRNLNFAPSLLKQNDSVSHSL